MNGITQTGYAPYIPNTAAVAREENAAAAKETAKAPEEAVAAAKTDVYTPSDKENTKGVETYEPPKRLTEEQVNALKMQVYESMRSLAEQMLGIQVGKEQDTGGIKAMSLEELAQSLGMGTTPETAAAAISEDGMWGVDAVATRLMDMAMALSDGDPSKAELLRKAVQDGFAAVGDLDSLPQVSQDTYAETMKRFDYWVENGSLEGYGEAADEEADEDAVPEGSFVS